MPDLQAKLAELLNRYDRDKTQPRTEADVSANFIDHLFAALGWDITNPNEYNRQRYVREAGFADVGLLLRGDPKVFVEIKRFGMIPKSTERTGDRTPEEKQAFKYARQEKIKWAILTNFERLHVFDADQERLILAFDDPQEYPRRIEDLNRLAKASIERDSLEHFAQLQAKEDLDRGFLESLKRWRKLLAQDILDHNRDNEVILTGGQPDLDKLRRVVQRILDRLVIIRFADDRELLDDFGVIEAMHAGFKARRSYAAEGQLYRDFLNFCAGMDRKHNTEIFSPKHPCERVTVSNDCLDQLLAEITAISFRKFSSDVLGNTYESYLGHRLELKDGRIELAERRDIRKGAGIYYTPTYIVRYIVDNTLGKKLQELEAQHGLNAGHEARKLKVLDPACGSGSFLIYAFDVLARFYERCNERNTAEKFRLTKESKPGDLLETQAKIKSLPKLLLSYPKIILEENLYGVDLDEEAAELASVNLIMKAFDRVSSNGRKLPLILNQNIKVGNSLIGYLPGTKLWEKTAIPDEELEHLISLRQQIRATDDDIAKRKLLDEAAERTREITAPLNEPLKKFFPDLATKHPFHWPAELPEVFARENAGFGIIIGNPPYSAELSDEEKQYFLNFQTGRGNLNTASLFLERSFNALRENGVVGMIIPKSFCYSDRWTGARRFFAKNLVAAIDASKAFEGVLLEQVIVVFGKVETKTVTIGKIIPEKVEVCSQERHKLGCFDVIPTALGAREIAIGTRICGENRFSGVCKLIRGKNLQQACLPHFDLPVLSGKEIARFALRPVRQGIERKTFNKIKNELSYLSQPKIVAQNIVAHVMNPKPHIILMAAYDEEGLLNLDTVVNIFPKKEKKLDPKFLVALLNSRLLSWYAYHFIYCDAIRTMHFDNYHLNLLPLPAMDMSKTAGKVAHDKLAKLAEAMLQLHRSKGKLEQGFAEALDNHPHDWKNLDDTYWNRADYVPFIGKKAYVKPSDMGAVTGLRCELDAKTIQISAKVADDWKPILDMTIADDKLRFFIFYGIRQFLRDNARKKKWGDGKLLSLMLENIEVPVFLSHGVHDPETHLKTLELVLAEMKKHSPLHNITEFDREIAATDQEIDRRVYDLYGLSEQERALVEESTHRNSKSA